MNEESFYDVNGTVIIDPPEDMLYSDIKKIVGAVTQVTGHEGGYTMSMTVGGSMMFFHMTEEQSDDLRSLLTEEMGEDILERIDYAYDDDFDDLGVVCQGCWEDIPPEDVYYDNEDNPYCRECYERIVLH